MNSAQGKKGEQSLREKAKNLFQKSPDFFQGHDLPQTRREFIGLGLLAGGAMVSSPWSLISRAWAQSSGNSFAANQSLDGLWKRKSLVIDCVGGAAFNANWLAGRTAPEDFCDNYTKHGWNPREKGALFSNFGLPMNQINGGIFRGLKSTLPAPLLENKIRQIQMASFCTVMTTDTAINQMSPYLVLRKLGAKGTRFDNGLGMRATLNGGNTQSFSISGSSLDADNARAKFIDQFDRLMNLTSIGKGILELPQEERVKFLDILTSMKEIAPAEAAGLYDDLAQFGSSFDEVHPLKSEPVRQAFPRLPAQVLGNEKNPQLLWAGLALATLKGFVGPSSLVVEDCDYHQGNEAASDDKDNSIGALIGSCLHLAYLLNEPLDIFVLTDGGCSNDTKTPYSRAWIGDSQFHSMAVLITFEPKGQKPWDRFQIGKWTDDGMVLATPPLFDPKDVGLALSFNHALMAGLSPDQFLLATQARQIETEKLQKISLFEGV